jgi:hypothetical protein
MTDKPECEGEALRPVELPLTDYEKALERSVAKTRGRPRNCARNAFHHLKRAWQLIGKDNEMAAFRAITAEEEAVTTVFLALKRRSYPGSEYLNLGSHPQKALLFHYIKAVGKKLSETNDIHPSIMLDEHADPPRAWIRFDARKLLGLTRAEPLFAEPVPPLHLLVHDDNGALTFADELKSIAIDSGFSEAIDFARSEGNLRNKLLYASDGGIPLVTIDDGFIKHRLSRVTTLLTIYLLIEQSPTHQFMVSQCLEGFLITWGKIDNHLSDFTIPTPSGRGVTVLREGEGPPQILYHERWSFNVNITWRWLPRWEV